MSTKEKADQPKDNTNVHTPPWTDWSDDWKRHDYIENRIMGAVSLVFIGCVLLLNTTGKLSWSVWLGLFRFWPVFIIMGGIGLLLSWSRVTKFIGSVLSFILFVMIMFVSAVSVDPNFLGGRFSGFSLNNLFSLGNPINNTATNNLHNQYQVLASDAQGVTSGEMKLNVDIGMGEYQIGDSTMTFGTDNWLQVNSSYNQNYGKPEIKKSVITEIFKPDTLGVNFTIPDNANFDIFNWSNQTPNYAFEIGKLTKSVDLTLKTGAGKGTVDLRNTKVQGLNCEVGAGDLTVNLGANSLATASSKIKVGAGNLTLNVPANTGLRINYKVGVGSLKFDGNDIADIGKDGTFETPGYQSTTQRMDIQVEVGVGNVTISRNL